MTYHDQFYNAAENDNTSDDLNFKKKATVDKKNIKYYESYTKVINDKLTDGKFYKTVKIELYGSGQMGSQIKNAVTGIYTPYIVGSADEDLFFTICDATGRYGRQDPLFLFYDSPEQYENHQFTVIDQPTKERWHAKNLAARMRN